MYKFIRMIMLLALIIFAFSEFTLYAEEGEGMPPAKVVVSEVKRGMLSPQAEFIGTVYYAEVSDVACEVSGKVEDIGFEEGYRIKKGAELVKLNSDLLMSDLEKAELDFNRAENLHKEDLISEEAYDERRFILERLRIELRKKTVKSPFDGVIIKKHVERGEWLSPGSLVATIANYEILDIIAEVPGRVTRYIVEGTDVTIKANGQEIIGKVFTVIPRGDVMTRTFPVKIRVNNPGSLMEGMDAVLSMPVGEKQEVLIVDRDAVINMFGNNVVFAVIDSKAMMITVQVIGYEGGEAGISAEGLAEGMKVVIKGNERLSPEQPVTIQQ